MKRKRKQHSTETKAKVAAEALRELPTVSVIARVLLMKARGQRRLTGEARCDSVGWV